MEYTMESEITDEIVKTEQELELEMKDIRERAYALLKAKRKIAGAKRSLRYHITDDSDWIVKHTILYYNAEINKYIQKYLEAMEQEIKIEWKTLKGEKGLDISVYGARYGVYLSIKYWKMITDRKNDDSLFNKLFNRFDGKYNISLDDDGFAHLEE